MPGGMRRYRAAPDPRTILPRLLAVAVLLGVLDVGLAHGLFADRDTRSAPRARAAAAVPPARPAAPLLPPRSLKPPAAGLWTFRGNASRSLTGVGPVPRRPRIAWRYPARGGLCSRSTDETGTSTWCGVGWTGQPNVIPRRSGRLEVRIGAYDRRYHFLDGATGRPVRAVAADRRPREGLGDLRPRRLPALLRGLPRQPAPRRRARPRASDRPLGARQPRGRQGRVERRLGRRAARRAGPPARRGRELLVLRHPAQPLVRSRPQGPRPAARRRARAELGRGASWLPGATGPSRSSRPSRTTAGSRTSRTRRVSSRAGTSARRSGAARRRGASSASGWATTRMRASSSTRRASSTSRASSSGTPSGRGRSASSSS